MTARRLALLTAIAVSGLATPAHAVRPPSPASPTDIANRFVDRWLAAQTSGAFDTYAAMYAPSFPDRKRWLAARKARFAKAQDVRLRTRTMARASGTGIVITLRVVWTQGARTEERSTTLTLDANQQIVGEVDTSVQVVIAPTDCNRVLVADGRRAFDSRVLVLDDDRSVCAVTTTRDVPDAVDYQTVLALVRGGDLAHATVLMRRDHPDVTTNGAQQQTEISVGVFELVRGRGARPGAPHVSSQNALELQETMRSFDAAGTRTLRDVTLYDVDATGLHPIVGFRSRMHERRGGNRVCRARPSPSDGNTRDDIAVSCWDVGVEQETPGYDEPASERRYRWNGSTYVLAP